MMCLCSVNGYPIFFFLIFPILLWSVQSVREGTSHKLGVRQCKVKAQ